MQYKNNTADRLLKVDAETENRLFIINNFMFKYIQQLQRVFVDTNFVKIQTLLKNLRK